MENRKIFASFGTLLSQLERLIFVYVSEQVLQLQRSFMLRLSILALILANLIKGCTI